VELVNRVSPSLIAATMLMILLLPLVSVAADTGRTNQAWQRSPDDSREIQRIIGALVLGTRVSGCSALPMITIPPVQVARTVSIRFVAEWRQGYDFARHAVVEVNGVERHKWVFDHSTDETFQETIDPAISNTIKAYTIYARDDDLQSRYYGHLYVDGNLVASSDDAGPLTPLVYVIPPSGEPERLEIAYVEYPRSVRTGESFVIDVTVRYVLNSPREVVVDLYENAGPLLASKRMMLSAEGSAIYDLMVTAPSTARRWQLNIHLQGEYKQSIYIDVGQVCNEGAVNVLETCPDGTWEHRQVCRNNAWVDEYQQCPVCSEGAVRNAVMCPDGVNWKQREVCRNNNWVPEYQTCPIVPTCSEGAINVLETCPDGSWKRRQVCRNNAWVDESQPCLPSGTATIDLKKLAREREEMYAYLMEAWEAPGITLVKYFLPQPEEIVKEAFLEFLPAYSVGPIDVNELLEAIDTYNEVSQEYDPVILPQVRQSVYDDFYNRIVPARLSYDDGYGNGASKLFALMNRGCDREALYRGDYEWWQVLEYLSNLLQGNKLLKERIQAEMARVPMLREFLSLLEGAERTLQSERMRALTRLTIAFLGSEIRFLETLHQDPSYLGPRLNVPVTMPSVGKTVSIEAGPDHTVGSFCSPVNFDWRSRVSGRTTVQKPVETLRVGTVPRPSDVSDSDRPCALLCCQLSPVVLMFDYWHNLCCVA
jgi:hypothetical protein